MCSADRSPQGCRFELKYPRFRFLEVAPRAIDDRIFIVRYGNQSELRNFSRAHGAGGVRLDKSSYV
jgi:hypothetical protein